VQFNPAFVIEGAIPAALLAVLLDQLMANVEKSFAYSPGAKTESNHNHKFAFKPVHV